MKKYFLLLPVFILALTLHGQQNILPLEKQLFHNTQSLRSKVRNHAPQLHLKQANEEKQRLDSLIGHLWAGGDSVPDYKEEFLYSDEGMITEHIRYGATMTEEWEFDDKQVYTYNDRNNLSTTSYYVADDDNGELIEKLRWQYTYGANDQVTEVIETEPSGEGWLPKRRLTQEYNEMGLLVTATEYDYDEGWIESWRSDYGYDASGTLLTIEEFAPDNNDEWNSEWLGEFFYDDQGRLAEYIESFWENEWTYFQRETFTYATNNNLESYNLFDWIDTSQVWVPTWREEYVYNNEYPYEQLILPLTYQNELPNSMNHMMVKFSNYIYTGEGWEQVSVGNFNYTPVQLTHANDVVKGALSFYPNPASDRITIRTNSHLPTRLHIYDLTGKLVLSGDVVDNLHVPVSQLRTGVYLLQLTAEKERVVKRFIKK